MSPAAQHTPSKPPSMAVWETEDEADVPSITAAAAAAALPTPTDTPYRTPSRRSRKSSRSATPPRKISPPPLPGDRPEKNPKRSSKDVVIDEKISILDPRRFTPTLHANLVAEILNLRRDQEEKMKFIDNLEAALQTSRQEQESLQESALGAAKENRSLKRQLALLEGGTSSALGELHRERDDAEETAVKLKKQLETAQKRLRAHEDDSQRMQAIWATEKDNWEEEKRKFERKLHVADSRLKAVLEEVAAFHAAQANGMNGNATDGEDGEDITMVGKDNDTVSVRTMSMTNSLRFSVLPGKLNGNSLADELDFGDETDETDTGGRESSLSQRLHHRSQSRDSVMSRTHRRDFSNESLYRPGSVARGRFLNQAVLERLEGVTIAEADEDQINSPAHTPKASKTIKVQYTDSAVQYSPPPSPELPPKAPSPEPVEPIELPQPAAASSAPPPIPARAADRSSREGSIDGNLREWGEIEANQRRKRVHIARHLTIETVSASSGSMISVGSQTLNEGPLSPPKTPKTPLFDKEQAKQSQPPAPVATVDKPLPAVPPMVESSTQTDPPTPPATPVPEIKEVVPLAEMPIPVISIHPPTSRPTTPSEPRLPPLVKEIGCQADISEPRPSRSVSVQTDEIRVDKRLDRLPPHLHPSAITSRPTSPSAIILDPVQAAVDDLSGAPTMPPGSLPPRNPRRLTSRPSSVAENTTASSAPQGPCMAAFNLEETHDAYPGNNDDGPLSNHKAPVRRPHRISSLFAGFDVASSDEADEFADADLSDSEFRTVLSAPKPKAGSATRSGSKRGSGGISGTTSPESGLRRSAVRSSQRMFNNITSSETYSRFTLPDSGTRSGRESAASRRTSTSIRSSHGSTIGGAGDRSSVMRKAAMIQNGIATHQGRSRSPSLPDSRNPPFPIPTRASSRNPPSNSNAAGDGRRSPTRAVDAYHRRGGSRNHHRASSIRKVRSAAAIPVKPRSHRRQGSRSPPPQEPIQTIFADADDEEHNLPPLPTNDITTPRYGMSSAGSRYRGSHHHQASINTAITAETNVGSVNSSNQATATGVVDAIAQTMVGEWMYKYVRRRKSFGAAETTGRDDSSNDRHKRWVWLAPYERAILWSSKQPSSNSMLLGKSGRKLTIQSVLDVKDDNPPPKGCPQLFHRSILILTPQRALKFTATTPERHYLWLTSLSFLAHSQQAIPENITAPPMPPALSKPPPDYDLARPKPRKNGIRDSIRLTKSKTAMVQGMSATPVPVPVLSPPPMSVASSHTDSIPPSIPSYRPTESYRPAESYTSAPSVAASVAASTSTHQRDTSRDTAEPPVIARFHDRSSQVPLHGRKRSNTGGHVPPPLSFRGFSGPSGGSNSSSYFHASTNRTAGNSDISQSQASSWGVPAAPGSQRTSEASSRPSGPVMSNFFDAIGTVRMEAFISPLAFQQMDDYPDEQEEMRFRARRRSKEMRRRASRSRHRDRASNDSRGTRITVGTDDFYGGSRTGGEEDFFRDDPFKGF